MGDSLKEAELAKTYVRLLNLSLEEAAMLIYDLENEVRRLHGKTQGLEIVNDGLCERLATLELALAEVSK